MADFKWDITDASAEEMPVIDGEEVTLDNLKVVLANSGWTIKESDKTVFIAPVLGGTVEKVGASEELNKSPKVVENMRSLNLGKAFYQTVIIAIILLVGTGFMVTLVSSVWSGKLGFNEYMMTVFSLFTGLGIGNFAKKQ